LGFDAKVSRLEAIVKHFRHSLTMPDPTEATAPLRQVSRAGARTTQAVRR
jgi:hypothetical protein